jgi:glycosyltransferase involved in cell wall biosynthesis
LTTPSASGAGIRLAYIADMRMPTERAHGVQIVRMCEAFEAAGYHGTLFYPRRRGNSLRGEDIKRYYNIFRPFELEEVRSVDLTRLIRFLPEGRLANAARLLDLMSFGWASTRRALKRPYDLYYTRDWPVAWWAVRRNLPTVFEAHSVPPSDRFRKMIGRMIAHGTLRLVVAITEGVKQGLVELGAPSKRVLVAPDGVRLEDYASDIGRAEARNQLGLDPNVSVVLYTGSLFHYKGVYVLAEAAQALPSAQVVLLGGSPRDVKALRRHVKVAGLSNVRVWGAVPPAEVPVFQAAADVVVAPNTADEELSARFTSPLKLFEYMAARRPIVASDLPSLREVLKHERNALLVPPGDPAGLAASVGRLLNEQGLADKLVETAAKDVQQYTWERRVQHILAAVKARSGRA